MRLHGIGCEERAGVLESATREPRVTTRRWSRAFYIQFPRLPMKSLEPPASRWWFFLSAKEST